MSRAAGKLIAVVIAITAGALGVWLSARHDEAPRAPAANAGRDAAGRSAEHAAVRGLFEQQWPDSNGEPVRLSDYRGQVLVLNYWATWCPPCLAEMPELSQLAGEFAGQEVKFVGIGIDNAGAIASYARAHPVGYRLLVAGFGGAESMKLLGNSDGSLPFTVVLKKDGEILGRISGPVDVAALRRVIAESARATR